MNNSELDENSFASDSDSGSDQEVSKFWRRDSSSSDSSSDDEDRDQAGCNANSKTKSLQEYIRSEEEEREFMSLDPDYAWEKIRSSQTFLEPPLKLVSPNTKSNPQSNNQKDYCRFVFISDTHGRHRDISYLPRGDVLVHSGDFTKSGETGTMEDLSAYFGELVHGCDNNTDKSHRRRTFSKVICVAGNHDLTLDQDYYDREWQRFHRQGRKFDPEKAQKTIRRHATYLHDESHVLECRLDNEDGKRTSSANIHVWGSPYSPNFFNWGFMKERGAPIREIWDKIPSKCDPQPVDLLITHGPPLGRGDLAVLKSGTKSAITTRAGCYDLLKAIQDRIQPKINVFGHIHEDHGVTYDGTTLYVNASTMNRTYEAVHLPIVIDVPLDEKASNEIPKVVQPSSLFCNTNTNITSLQEWIQWCNHHGHSQAANALEKGFSAKTAEKWFGQKKEPPLDQLLHDVEAATEFYEPPTRESRRQLATMVFHLYALALEDETPLQPEP